MPRRTRKNLVGKLEERLTEERAEALRELLGQLRRERRTQVARGSERPVVTAEPAGGAGDE
jgi:hypothetical protein